jgi:hypothetical protein
VVRVPGEVQGRLTGGVATTHDDRSPSAQTLGIEGGCAVVDARRLVGHELRHAEPSVGDAGGEDNGPCQHPPTGLDPDDEPVAVVGFQRRRSPRVSEGAAEHPRLLVGALR